MGNLLKMLGMSQPKSGDAAKKLQGGAKAKGAKPKGDTSKPAEKSGVTKADKDKRDRVLTLPDQYIMEGATIMTTAMNFISMQTGFVEGSRISSLLHEQHPAEVAVLKKAFLGKGW